MGIAITLAETSVVLFAVIVGGRANTIEFCVLGKGYPPVSLN